MQRRLLCHYEQDKSSLTIESIQQSSIMVYSTCTPTPGIRNCKTFPGWRSNK